VQTPDASGADNKGTTASGLSEFGLSPRALGLLREVFAQNVNVERAIVYGSRAKGNYRNGSDIDITLDGPELTFADLMRIETALDDLMLPWEIDLSLLSHINNPDLLAHIARVGKPLWVREGKG
jgi:predicted nucleotidyltransferase